jgi:putative cobalt transporter subunit CbtB
MAGVLAPVRERPISLIALAALALFALYLMAVDQGHLLALAQGSLAFDQNFIHELVHDSRHAAGFPCH